MTQGTPPVPQAAFAVPVLQVFPSQQPLEHVAGVQTFTQEPFWHCVPLGQGTQVAPFEPQAALVLPALTVGVTA